MNRKKLLQVIFLTAVIGIVIFFSGCFSMPKDYPDFGQSRPRSILVMPPLNNSVDVSASAVFLAASTRPLAESGYYVIPVTLSHEMFRQNGIYTAADANAISSARLYEIFGADCALYITILRFGTVFQLVRSVVQAEASAKLVDLKTDQILWSGYVFIEENPSDSYTVDPSVGFLAQVLFIVGSAVIDQIANNLSNASYDVGFRAAEALLDARYQSGLPYGPYHPKYETN